MFGTSGVRGRFGTEVTTDLACSIGRAVASDGAERIVLGRDTRTTGPLLSDAVAAGARECGADVVDVGVASTPSIARSVGWQDADAGVTITASHNPPSDNGIKLWTPSGMAFDEDRRERVTGLVQSGGGDPAAWDAVGTRERWHGAAERHRTVIQDAVDVDGELSVVVDVGNGAGTVTAPALRALGCSVQTANADPDGRFPSRPSEPTDASTGTLQAIVEATGADLGIAHDGDADRMLAVDDQGRFVPGDRLLALFAREALRDGEHDRVVVPVNTSLVVDDVIEAAGGTVSRTRVGDVFVAEAARETDVAFGGEPSGAWIWPDETLAPDGALAACTLAALVSRQGPLSGLVDDLPSYPLRRRSREVDRKRAVVGAAADLAADRYDAVNRTDGLRVETDDGWFLVRASGTQPLVRLTAQARSAETVDEVLDEATDLLEAGLDSV